MKKPQLILTFLFIITVALSITRIFVSNTIATSGVVLQDVTQARDSLRLENSLLSQRLYEDSSLTNISEKATKIGYTDKKTDFVLSTSVPVAIKQ